MNSELAGFPVKDLPDRYKIGRTILYERINALSLSLEKVSNRAYVDETQLRLLDALDAHIKAGGITSEFLREHGLSGDQGEQTRQLTQKIRTPERLSRVEQDEQMVKEWRIAYALTREICGEILSPQTLSTIADRMTDPLQPLKMQQERLRMLAEIAEQGWLIPTSQMLQLLGLRSTPELTDGWFQRRGFMFIKTSRKGRESEWRVKKI